MLYTHDNIKERRAEIDGYLEHLNEQNQEHYKKIMKSCVIKDFDVEVEDVVNG